MAKEKEAKAATKITDGPAKEKTPKTRTPRQKKSSAGTETTQAEEKHPPLRIGQKLPEDMELSQKQRTEVREIADAVQRMGRNNLEITISYLMIPKVNGQRDGKGQVIRRKVSVMEERSENRLYAPLGFMPAVGDKITIDSLFMYDGTDDRFASTTFYVTSRSYAGFEDDDADNFTGLDIRPCVVIEAVQDILLPWWKRLFMKAISTNPTVSYNTVRKAKAAINV